MWVLKHPQLRVRSEAEVAGESPLTHQSNLSGEPHDEQIGIEDVLELLAEYEGLAPDLTTSRLTTSLQITTRHARDLADELVECGIVDRREPSGTGANFYWLADSYSADDVEQLLGEPEPEIDPVDQLSDAIHN